MHKEETERQKAVERYRAGESATAIWQSLKRSKHWFYHWLGRYRSGMPAWYEERTRARQTYPDRTPGEIEAVVKMLRLELFNRSEFCGSQAIRWEMERMGVHPLPGLRTIERILKRNELTHKRTGRYQPKGKAYPKLEGYALNEVHQADWLGPLYLHGPIRFYSLNAVDLATGRCGIQPATGRDAQSVYDAFWAIWGRLGIPENLQVDNDKSFYGSPTHPRGMGPLIRLCLHNGVEPWFIPPFEPWRNGVVEKFNDHYRHKFLGRVEMGSWPALNRGSLVYEGHHNSRYRYSKLGGRTPLKAMESLGEKPRFPFNPIPPRFPLEKPVRGKYHVVRFIRGNGRLDLFGETFWVPKAFQYEYVVGTVNVASQKLELFHDGLKFEEYAYKMR